MKKPAILTALLGLAFGNASATSLLGNTFEFQYFYPTLSSNPYPNSANGLYKVGSGIEIGNVADGSATMDIQKDRIVIDFLYGNRYGDAGAEFNGWVLRDIYGKTGGFTSVTVDPSTTFSGIANGLSFTSDTIQLNWKGLAFTQNDLVVLNIKTGLPVVTSPIPEPESVVLMCAGVLGIAAFRRRAKAQDSKNSES